MYVKDRPLVLTDPSGRCSFGTSNNPIHLVPTQRVDRASDEPTPEELGFEACKDRCVRDFGYGTPNYWICESFCAEIWLGGLGGLEEGPEQEGNDEIRQFLNPEPLWTVNTIEFLAPRH